MFHGQQCLIRHIVYPLTHRADVVKPHGIFANFRTGLKLSGSLLIRKYAPAPMTSTPRKPSPTRFQKFGSTSALRNLRVPVSVVVKPAGLAVVGVLAPGLAPPATVLKGVDMSTFSNVQTPRPLNPSALAVSHHKSSARACPPHPAPPAPISSFSATTDFP